VHGTGGSTVGETHVVPERGVLTASSEAWDLAVRRAEVIGSLAELDEVGHRCADADADADAAADELGLSRRQVYVLLRRWRRGEGVVSDMLPDQSSGGRGREHLPEAVEAIIREVLRTRYLTKQRRSMSAVHREVARLCRVRGLPAPSRGALVRRAGKLDPVATTLAREGADAARSLRSAGGVPPQVGELLEQVHVDHTVIDVMVVDERHRLPIAATVCHRGD
jgi:putative transposase